MDEPNLELEITEEDKALWSSLGANAVDRDVFEQQFLEKLEEEYELRDPTGVGRLVEKVNNEAATNIETHQSSSNSQERLAVADGSGKIAADDVIEKHDEVENKESIPSSDPKSSNSSRSTEEAGKKDPNSGLILKSLLQGKESEAEMKIRLGEMTPFGAVLEASSEKKKTFQDLDTYLETQIALDAQFRRTLKTKNKKKSLKKKSESSCSDSEQDPVLPHSSKSSTVRRLNTLDKKSRRGPLNMSVMFPKKRKKKALLGTDTSEDQRSYRRRPGKSLAEQGSMYLNASDDSDYIPSDEQDSGTEISGKKRRRPSRESTKSKKKYERSESSEYDSDEYDRPARKRKKQMDDGDIEYYQNRVKEWKETETRFTTEVYTMHGGFKLPMHIWQNLYNYQKVGVKWLWELHQQRSGGILGDEMGLGKTIQIICFLAGLSCSNMVFRFSEFRGMGPSLIICPATVMHQWVQEFHKWWPPFRVVILHESGAYSGTKHGLVRSAHESKGILITTYTGLVNNQNEILKYNWHYVVLDEGHKIRNPDALITLAIKQVKTPHRIILSGSPLQNNLKELWSLFDFVFPGKLGTLPVFMEQFSVPITQGGYSNASDVQVAAAFKCATTLRDLISPYLLRRMKTDVGKHINLPAKNEQVLFCKLSEEQKTLYQNYLKSDEIGRIIQGHHNVFAGLVYLRKICNHPHLYDGGPKLIKPSKKNRKCESEDDDVNRFRRRVPKTKAGSSAKLASEDDEGSDIEIDPSESFGHWSKSGKMVVVKTLLKLWQRQEHKVLLFTQSRQMLCILENFLKQEGYSYLRLDGSTSIGARQPMIQKFNQEPSIFVFILTTRVGGLGVNLTGADRVILFDPDWNPSTDLQARERAWRIGQEKQVTIYRLITSGTIEEKIYHRQIFKQFLTNRVLKDPRQKRFFKSNDMMELFTYNDGSNGTETEAIFAGTKSTVKIPKRRSRKKSTEEPREKSSGKFRGIPNLVKQKTHEAEKELEAEKKQSHREQDEYVLRKLFKKSGVEGALKHDKIMDASDPDYLIVEKEAERVAKDAVKVLRRSREQCWAAETGRVTWTGSHGSLNASQKTTTRLKSDRKPCTGITPQEPQPDPLNLFSQPKLSDSSSKEKDAHIVSSKELLAIIMSNNRSLVEPPSPPSPAAAAAIPFPGDDFIPSESEVVPRPAEVLPVVKEDYVELLREIREFIAFRAMVDGQASTAELVSEFGTKLPAKDSPLFKQMLTQLCNHRQVEGQRIWRLKLEFR